MAPIITLFDIIDKENITKIHTQNNTSLNIIIYLITLDGLLINNH